MDIASFANKNSEGALNSFNVTCGSGMFLILQSSKDTEKQIQGVKFLFSIMPFVIFKTIVSSNFH